MMKCVSSCVCFVCLFDEWMLNIQRSKNQLISSHRHEEKSSFSSRCTLEDTLLQAGSSNRANGRSTSNNKRVKLGVTTSNV